MRKILQKFMSTTTAPLIRNYDQAITCLNSMQSNASTLDAIRRSQGKLQQKSLPDMLQYLRRIGYQPRDLERLNVAHVAGTKGKGSTCAFLESILRHNGNKTGLFSSPHLIQVRERIRINGTPLSQPDFARNFFEVYDRLNTSKESPDDLEMPQYFRFLTLMSFHVFLQENVDVAIMEVGIGGEFDSTNIVERPVVCGVSALGLDHQALLGNTLAEISWHKAGIFKDGVPALSVYGQHEDAWKVLKKRSLERHAPLAIAPKLEEYAEFQEHPDYQTRLGLKGGHQKDNAALALAMANVWLNRQSSKIKWEKGHCLELERSLSSLPVTKESLNGLFNTKWPGRAQIVHDSKSPLTFYLDGAHTAESLQVCADWFSGIEGGKSVLIFNCTMGRNPLKLLGPLVALNLARPFDRVIFTTNALDGGPGDLVNNMVATDETLEAQKQMKEVWDSMTTRSHSLVSASVKESVDLVRSLKHDEPVKVLCTGSLHLVGAVLTVLEAPVE